MDVIYVVSIIATVFNGLLTGASLDQSIKQLPSRHKMGLLTFTKYAQAADLGNGVLFYGILGIGAATTTILATILVFVTKDTSVHAMYLYIAALFSILHTFTTTQAAPVYHSQKKVDGNEQALEKIFNTFEKWQTLRSLFLVITFITSLLAVIR